MGIIRINRSESVGQDRRARDDGRSKIARIERKTNDNLETSGHANTEGMSYSEKGVVTHILFSSYFVHESCKCSIFPETSNYVSLNKPFLTFTMTSCTIPCLPTYLSFFIHKCRQQ